MSQFRWHSSGYPLASRSICRTLGPQQRVVNETDLGEPQKIISYQATRDLLDFAKPLAVLLAAVPHFPDYDDEPLAIIAAICDAVRLGSYIAISHVTSGIRGGSVSRAAAEYKRVTPGATLRGAGGDPPVLRQAGSP